MNFWSLLSDADLDAKTVEAVRFANTTEGRTGARNVMDLGSVSTRDANIRARTAKDKSHVNIMS